MMHWALDIALIGLLAATLVQAVRLERALGVLRRDRSELEQLVAGFNASTRQAELGVERLRAAADGAGRQIARQIDAATALKDDLTFLTERGNRLADRLDAAVRSGRYLTADLPPPYAPPAPASPPPALPSQPPPAPLAMPPREMIPLGMSASGMAPAGPPPLTLVETPPAAEESERPRLRSQAERDLVRALRMAR